MARPSPEPPSSSRARSSSSRTNRSKTRSRCPSGMPGPSSRTVSTAWPSDAVSLIVTRLSACRPALSTRLPSKRSSRPACPWTTGSASTSVRTSTPSRGSRAVTCPVTRSASGIRASPSTWPASSLLSSSRSPVRLSIRDTSSTAFSKLRRQSSRSGWASWTSSWVRIDASGVRSSCDASAVNWLCRCTDRSSRASIAFIVTASSVISSPESGTGTRRPRSRARMPSTSARMAPTERSDRRTANQATAPTSSAAAGTPPQRIRRAVATVSRPSGSSRSPAATW